MYEMKYLWIYDEYKYRKSGVMERVLSVFWGQGGNMAYVRIHSGCYSRDEL